MKSQNKQKPGRVPISIGNAGAVMSILNRALNVDAVQVSLASYIEGRGLTGSWRLEIQSARLVPADVPAQSPASEGG